MPKEINMFESLDEGKNGHIYKQLSERIAVLEGTNHMLVEEIETLKQIMNSYDNKISYLEGEINRLKINNK